MALKHLRRSFMGTCTTASYCTSSILGFNKLPLMARLQCKAFQSRPAAHLGWSSPGIGHIFGKCSQIQLKRVRLSCKMAVQQSTLLSLDQQLGSHPSRILMDGSRRGTCLQSLSRCGFTNPFRRFSITSNMLPTTSVRLGSAKFEVASRRTFSADSMPKSRATNTCGSFAKDPSQNSVKFRAKNKRWKWIKTAAARKSRGDAVPKTSSSQSAEESFPNPQLSADKGVNLISSSEAMCKDGKKKALAVQSVLVSSSGNSEKDFETVLKQKPKSRSKKKKAEHSTTLSSSDAVSLKRSGKASEAQNCENSSTVLPSRTAKNSTTTNAPREVVDASASANQSSKKVSKSSRRKGKSQKDAGSSLKTNGALPEPGRSTQQVLSCGESLNKSKPHVTIKNKPQGDTTLQPLYPSSGKSVVVVESLTKAKVIQGYLGDMYEVIPSNGHVRDLAARSGSVRPDDGFSMVWEVPSAAWTHLKSIKVAIAGAHNLILASDPDREGEAIAWHIIEMLQQQDALHEDITVARVVFHEVTEAAIKNALQSPRNIDANLVNAYLARRALDYLIGFNISPLLWRKLPGCQSAGRVQSAALSLICDREMEIGEFVPQEYWTVETMFKTDKLGSEADKYSFLSYLTHFDSQKLGQLSVATESEAKNIEQLINSSSFKVIGSKIIKTNRNPPTPFITSTLQQDAGNKLNFPASYTMKLAQKLYEGVQLSDGKAAGLITYMRTDGLHISDEAVQDIRSFVIDRYGWHFAPKTPRKFFKKVKNAQEAHEAIRPTDIRRLPSTLVGILDEDSLKLYSLIWSRTMACQMEPAKIDQIQVDIGNNGDSIAFRAACSRVEFLGYRAVYDDVEAKAINKNENGGYDCDEAFEVMSNLKPGDECCLDKVEVKQHHTQPPPRYSEASLVKKLEELGIGRPSTYAITLKVLQDRKYVTVKSRVLYPEFRGRMVSAFLAHYFTEVTDYSFTADMETELDNVSAGLTEWKGLLSDYWTRFSTYCEHVNKVHIHQVERMLEKTFGDFLFTSLPVESRTCPSCLEGTLIFKVSRFGEGYFIGCDQHPSCKYIAKTLYCEEEEEVLQQNGKVEEPKLLGLHPVFREKVFLKNGPYGFYVQLGEDRKGYAPKRTSVPKFKDADSITLEDAVELLRYPITVGYHPDDGLPLVLKISNFGFTIRHRRNIAPVPKNIKPNDITLEKALKLLSGDGVRRSGRPKSKPKLEEAMEAF